jgi:hypothetical protein
MFMHALVMAELHAQLRLQLESRTRSANNTMHIAMEDHLS